MELHIVLFFLGVSLTLYCILGGADFGAGIVEWWVDRVYGDDISALTKRAMGPVWEANHMWLILVVVILFNGFPKIYAELSIYFHIPLTFLLIGVILRGCAYTFRHYDVQGDRSAQHYTRVFRIASLLTPWTMGAIAAALASGHLPNVEDYYQTYVSPWANLTGLLVGFFVVILFTFLAAVFFVGETSDQPLADKFRHIAKVSNGAALVVGLLILVHSWWFDRGILAAFWSHKLSILAMFLATFLLVPLWMLLKGGQSRHRIRVIASLQMACVLGGWLGLQFPGVIVYADPLKEPLTFYSAAAPDVTLSHLVDALVVGSFLIFPFLFYLFKVFKSQNSA